MLTARNKPWSVCLYTVHDDDGEAIGLAYADPTARVATGYLNGASTLTEVEHETLDEVLAHLDRIWRAIMGPPALPTPTPES